VAWRDLLNRLARRQEPFVYEALLAGTQAALTAPRDADVGREVERQQKLDMLRLLLVARGDHSELDALLANAPLRTSSFVRKCRQYAGKLTEPQAQSLFDAALVSEDPEVASELIEWAVLAQPEMAANRLWQFWNEPPTVACGDELLEIAMRLLVSGDKRGPLLLQLREAIANGPLPGRWLSLPYEALNSMGEPLHLSDVTLCAELLLKMPLADAAGEQQKASRWPDGTVGFPLIAAVATRLRAADALMAEQVFTAMVDELLDDPRRTHISRQRLKVFWRSLSFRPDLQRMLGRITARLWVTPEEPDDVTDGAAVWLQARHAEHEQQYVEAERRYRRAGSELLCLPSMRGEARWLLGDRNTMNGDDPLAALSAAPYRMRLLAAQKLPNKQVAPDKAAIAKASLLVREFAGNDRETLAILIDNPVESGR